MKRIALRYKEHDQESRQLADLIAQQLLASGFDPFPSSQIADPHNLDLCLCLGGDGTLLSTLRLLGDARFKVPVLGLHSSLGLGFLHDLKRPLALAEQKKWAQDLAQSLKAQHFKLEARWGLESWISPEKKIWALNDFVISKGPLARMIYVRVLVGEDVLFRRLRGDGLVVSSATGSTAYSLSAGGPVVQPTLPVLIVTPICPHDVAQRPLVLDSAVPLTLEVIESNTPCYLTSDGQEKEDVEAGTKIVVARSMKAINLLRFNQGPLKAVSYFDKLRSKLRYGGDIDAT
jgi:NAD+ kinase